MQQITPYKSSSSTKKKQVTRMFNTISGEYDRLNRIISLGLDIGWRKRLVRMATKDNPKKVLDVATGTADLALSLATISDEVSITGIDISSKMIAVGQEKIVSSELEHQVHLIIGDSEALPFDNEQFDLITVAFGVRNFENLNTGLSEIYRVLRPNGKLLILETAVPTNILYKSLYKIYSRLFLPMIGRLFSKDRNAYSYLSHSAAAFPHGKTFNDILRKTGFSEVRNHPQSLGVASIYSAIR